MYYGSWGRKGSDMTERLNRTELKCVLKFRKHFIQNIQIWNALEKMKFISGSFFQRG